METPKNILAPTDFSEINREVERISYIRRSENSLLR